ncbi:MAG: hypothetical protein QF463_10735 [Vicinamibacterales bacterium]|nr:hypothetical protein [Vicinamibacterales bacterium]MDP6609529.1 hypothetical protein [Vicinamibacterales bacterium]
MAAQSVDESPAVVGDGGRDVDQFDARGEPKALTLLRGERGVPDDGDGERQ